MWVVSLYADYSMKMKSLIWLVLVVFALPLVAFAEGKACAGTTNDPPATEAARLVIDKWRLAARLHAKEKEKYTHSTVTFRRGTTYNSYFFLQRRVGRTNAWSFGPFVTIERPLPTSTQSREDELWFGFCFRRAF
jgi:hypothetical protein